MLRDPPLVEKAMATSSGLRVRDQLAQENDVGADVVGDGGDVGRLQRERDRRDGPISLGGATQSIIQSLASVADPPLPKRISFPPRSRRSCDRRARVAQCASASSPRHLVAERRVIGHLHPDRRGDPSTQRRRDLPLTAKKRIEEASVADVVAKLATLEEDVHRLPQRVVQDLENLLVDEGIVGGRDQWRTTLRAPGGRTSSRLAPRPRRAPPTTSGRRRRAKAHRRCPAGRRIASSQRAKSIERSRAGRARLPTITG